MNILITGGAGFIGLNLAHKLQNLGNKITIVDNLHPQIHSFKPNLEGFDFIYGDACDLSILEKAFSNQQDYVFHLVSETGTNQSMNEVLRYSQTNIQSTSALCHFLTNNKTEVKKVILSSSRAVYGNNPNDSRINKVGPVSFYGVTKKIQEEIINFFFPNNSIIFRFQNVYGPGQSFNNPYTGLVTIFINQFVKNKKVQIFDNGLPYRDFIYVDDVTDALIISITNERLDNNRVFDLGTNEKTLILSLAYILKDLIGSSSEIEATPYHRDGDIIGAVSMNDLFSKLTGWKPQIGLKEGLNRLLNYYSEQTAAKVL